MSDNITQTHLEAALIDQNVAGRFRENHYAFVAVVSAQGWQLGVAVANQKGYHPINKHFVEQEEATAWADGLNAHIGLDEDRAMRIIFSTMGGRRYEERDAA